MSKTSRIHPEVKDIWLVARVVQMTIGFNLGLYLFIYGVFFYEAFGGLQNPASLMMTAVIFMVMEVVCFLTDIPTGVLGDHIGRKKIVIYSFVFRALFFFFLAWIAFVPSVLSAFILAALSVTCFGIGYTFYSGSFVAWVVDTLRERNHTEGIGIVLARSYGSMALAQMFGAGISLPLYLSGYVYYAFALGFTSCILCAVFCGVVMKETKTIPFHEGELLLKDSIQKMKNIVVDGFKISIKTPPVIYLMLMYTAFMFLTHVVAYLWPVAMKTNFGIGKMSPYWYAIVFFSLVLTFAGSKAAEWLAHGHPSNASVWKWFVIICLIMAVPIAWLGFKTEQGQIPLLLFIFSVAFCRFGYGFLRPCYETLVNKYIPDGNSQQRATIMSFGGTLVSLVVFVLMIPAAGKTGEETTIGWLIPSGILIVLTLVLGFLMRRYQRRIGELPS